MRRLLLVLLLTGCAGGSREPHPNLGVLRKECLEWHRSGGYAGAFARAAEPALRTAQRMPVVPGRTAVVFDIDETLLTNWEYLRKGHFVLEQSTFEAWVRRSRGVPLAPTREVYRIAQLRGADIFLISGRGESIRGATERELREAGYSGWKGLFLKPDSYGEASIIPFKSGVRKKIASRGYDIVLNLGDQHSDLDGGYARQRVKLPNPFYFIP